MGKTEVGKGMKLQVLVDGSRLPLALEAADDDVGEPELWMPALN